MEEQGAERARQDAERAKQQWLAGQVGAVYNTTAAAWDDDAWDDN